MRSLFSCHVSLAHLQRRASVMAVHLELPIITPLQIMGISSPAVAWAWC
jgi:hypothetical protein